MQIHFATTAGTKGLYRLDLPHTELPENPMMRTTIDLRKFHPFRPLAMRSCVLGGYSDFQALVIADRAERGFADAYPHERAIAQAQAAQAQAQADLEQATRA